MVIADASSEPRVSIVVPYKELQDPELIAECLEGDQAAWEELISRYGRLIYSIPLKYGLSESDASDIFQSVCLMMLEKLGTLRDRTKLSSWLITTTSRECWRLKGRSRIYQQSGDESFAEHEIDRSPLPDDVAISLEEQNLVRQALRGLSERQRRLVWYLFYDKLDLSYSEIAERLGLPLGSIGPTRARCLAKLKAILKEIGFD